MTNSQRVLVTGGRTGIGRAIAEGFLREGARVFICGMMDRSNDETSTGTDRLRNIAADVADPDAVARLFEIIAQEAGGLDVLVNNAGISGPTAPIDEMSIEDWSRTIAVNLSGPFYCARQAVALMKAQKNGLILNISTTSARVALPRRAPYVASKTGLHGLTRSLARELGVHNIRCNTISPGMVDNARGARVRAARAAAEGVSPEELLQYRLGFISMQTMVTVEDVAETALFLASARARHISGQEISVCGNLEWE